MWDGSKKGMDWEEDALYGTIRRYQPQCLIINNTGLSNRGAAGHIELDGVTFERSMPTKLNMEGAPKYLACEMCEVMGENWGYAKDDLKYRSPAYMIEELVGCRRYGANMLLNVGPMENGYLRPMDGAMLSVIGQWVEYFDEAIRRPRPCGISLCESGSDANCILRDGKSYYLFCHELPVEGTSHVTLKLSGLRTHENRFDLEDRIREAYWLDNGEPVAFEQRDKDTLIRTVPYKTGRNLVVRVAKIVCE